MSIIRIGRPLREYISLLAEDDPELQELADFLSGFPVYPAGIELPEEHQYDVWYYADLLLALDPTPGERRACNAALADLEKAGFQP